MTMKRYSTFPKAPALLDHHQQIFTVIFMTLFGQRFSWCILRAQWTLLYLFWGNMCLFFWLLGINGINLTDAYFSKHLYQLNWEYMKLTGQCLVKQNISLSLSLSHTRTHTHTHTHRNLISIKTFESDVLFNFFCIIYQRKKIKILLVIWNRNISFKRQIAGNIGDIIR